MRFPQDLDEPPDGGPPTLMRRLSAEAPFVRIEVPSGGQMWLASSRSAVKSIFANPVFTREIADVPSAQMVGPDLTCSPHSVLTAVARRHGALRRVLGPAFVRSTFQPIIRTLEEDCRSQTREMLASPRPIELVADYIAPASATFAKALLDLPDRRWPTISTNARTHSNLASSPAAIKSASASLTGEAACLLSSLTKQGGAATPIDLLRTAAADGVISRAEARDTAAVLFLLSTDAIVSPLIAGALHLLRDTALRNDCLRRPALWKLVALEACRYANNALVEIPRRAAQDIMIEGVMVRRGEIVTTSCLAADWDETDVIRPAEFRIDRGSRGALTFGWGRRACIARGAATAAVSVVLRVLFEAAPELRHDANADVRPPWAREPNAIPVLAR